MKKTYLSLLILTFLSINTVLGQVELIKRNDVTGSTIKIFLTSKNSADRLSQKPDCKFEYCPQPEEDDAAIIIDDSKKFQTFLGMGGAFTDASAETFYKMPSDIQEELINAYFDPTKGISYTLGRIPIHSCDFSSSSFTYTDENDKSLKSFSIQHDTLFRIPFIQKAQEKAGGRITFYASPWSAPAWMKTNNSMLNGGKLKPEMFQTWANYLVKFVIEYKKKGIPIWGLTVQNEPMSPQRWESCTYTAEEERDFVKNFLGPTFFQNKLQSTKLIIWDHNRGLIYQRAKIVYDDPEASKYIWGAGFHWYTGNHYDNIRLVHDAYPDKNLLFTEGCLYPYDYKRIKEWNSGEQYATSIINDFNNWAVGWTDWNLILDETGGPNHVKNFCFAPIIADTKTGQLHYMTSYYYIGHFSKFLKPGAKRIVCSSVSDDLLATAFINPNGTIVIIVMNPTDFDKELKLWYKSNIVKTIVPAHSIITLLK